MKHNQKIRSRQKFTAWDLYVKVLLILSAFACGAISVSAQKANVGKLDGWSLNRISSREKNDYILPVSYKLRVSGNKDFDRVVFEFEEKEVPEYTIYYTKPPITLDPNHLENPKRPAKDEIITVGGKAFVIVCFALSYDASASNLKFPGGQNLFNVRDIKAVDWFENFFSFAIGLSEKKAFRVQELTNPARLVVDFKR